MNNVSSSQLTDNDLQFYAASLRCIIPANEIIQKKMVSGFSDLHLSPFSPIKKQVKQVEIFSQKELTATKEISKIAHRMFSALKSGDARLANQSYDEFTASILELNDELSPELEGFEGTDLVIITPKQEGSVKNGITRREFAKIDFLYKRIQSGISPLLIKDSESHPEFREEVLRNIRILLSRDCGRRLLRFISFFNKREIKIKRSDFSSFDIKKNIVRFDPNYRDLEIFNENGSRHSLFPLNLVSLFHELLHAKHLLEGRMFHGSPLDPAFRNREEEFTITGKTNGCEEYLSENRLLAEFDCPTRCSHYSIASEWDINEVFTISARDNSDGIVERILETNLVSQNSLMTGLEHAAENANGKIYTSIRSHCNRRQIKVYRQPFISPLEVLSALASSVVRVPESSGVVSSERRKSNPANLKNTRKKIAMKFSKFALTGGEVDALLNEQIEEREPVTSGAKRV